MQTNLIGRTVTFMTEIEDVEKPGNWKLKRVTGPVVAIDDNFRLLVLDGRKLYCSALRVRRDRRVNKRVKCRVCGQEVVANARGQVLAHTRSTKVEPGRHAWATPRAFAEPCPGAARGARP